jgi:hypothetical protein
MNEGEKMDFTIESKKDSIKRIIEKIESEALSKEFIRKHKSRREDFSRSGEIKFGDVINFVIGKSGTSLDFEVINYFKGRETSVSSSAISQARDKVQYTAFAELLKASSDEIMSENTFKGYKLTAYDGMKGEMPNRAELREKYAITEKKLQFHAVAEYDVLNCSYTNAVFEGGTTDERASAIKMIEEHRYDGAEILTFDRGFPSLRLIQVLSESNKKYVMRVSKSFLKEVNEFGAGKDKDKTVTVKCDKRRCTLNGIKSVVVPYEVNIRCVKIELKTGEVELLITNLPKSEFSREDLKELYNLRWKIETGFLHLKYAVYVEDFISVKENGVKQEFFAALINANIFMQFTAVSDTIIYNKKNKIRNETTRLMSEKP